MIVDAELGMPLDLAQFEGLWDYEAGEEGEEDYGASPSFRPYSLVLFLYLTVGCARPVELNPDVNNLPTLDPEDEALCADLADIPSSSNAQGQAATSNGAATTSMNVSWLRTNQHVGSSASANIPGMREMYVPIPSPPLHASLLALLMTLTQTQSNNRRTDPRRLTFCANSLDRDLIPRPAH